MYLCYIDESGTPEIPGNTSHFVLAGLSMPIWHWRDADREVTKVLSHYGLADEEFHTAWLLRKYLEQSRVQGFEKMDDAARRTAVGKLRTAELLRLQKLQESKAYKQARKNYRHTEAYTHLTYNQRVALVRDIADLVSGWGFARLFVESINKIEFNPNRTTRSVAEQAFEQVISRFHRYLVNIEENPDRQNYGLLIHDNNQSVAKNTILYLTYPREGLC